MLMGRQSKFLQSFKNFRLLLELRAFGNADGVEHSIERALGNGGRVKLFERAGGGVARVLKERFAGLLPFDIQLLEVSDLDVDFAARLEETGQILSTELQRNGADSLEIRGDIVA